MSAVCRRAGEQDREALKRIWKQSFEEDSEQEIDLFFDTFDFAQTALVLCEEEQVCSMLFLLPITIEDGARRVPAGYIYAGATHPNARGKGCYRRLLEYASEVARQEGMAALVLRPATDALTESYHRMGFSNALFGNACAFAQAAISTETSLSAQAYIAHRRAILRKHGQAFIDWDERVIAYALTWCDARLTEKKELFLISQDGGYIGEYLPPQPMASSVAALLKPLTDDFEATPIWFGYGLE